MSKTIDTDQRLPAIPDPTECARRPTVAGTPVLMGDGRTWPLAAYIPTLGGAWDRLYDDNVLRGKYQPDDVRLAASQLLFENFDLAPEAVATLIVGADLAALVLAVEVALFGPTEGRDTYSDWAIGSLYANGLDPATVPPDRLRDILDFLVACKRTIPPGMYISSAIAAPRYREFRAKLEVCKARDEAAAKAKAEAEATPAEPAT
jgi:hypothetical protein